MMGPRELFEGIAPGNFDLFGFVDHVDADRFSATYHSGASAYYDLQGFIAVGKAVGVAADLLQPRTIHLVRRYLLDGGKVFVDSGAYSRFRAWAAGKAATPVVDFARAFQTYDQLLVGLPPEARSRLALVMPDVVGDLVATIELIEIHRCRVLGYIGAGADVLVPIQRGDEAAGQTVDRLAGILGTRRFRIAIPSAAASMSLPDIATIRGHRRFHILGRGAMGQALYRRTYAFLEQNPGADASCDSTQLRARTDELSRAHTSLLADNEGCNWEGEFDDTELLHDVLNTNDWMSDRQVAAIARFYGVSSRAQVRLWIQAHRYGEDALQPLIAAFDPEADLLWRVGLADVFGEDAFRHLSARLRACAVSAVFAPASIVG